MFALTPLDPWIRKKTGIDPRMHGKNFVRALQQYQLEKINSAVMYARKSTAFYKDHLHSVPTHLTTLSDIASIPFTESSDISQNPFGFLAVNQNKVARIVTLRTSGSTGESKRLFFTEADLELTIDFFHHGMSTMVKPGQKVAVLLPGDKPDSVGDLLRRGLLRMDIKVLPYGPVSDPEHAAETIGSFGADCLVGIPTHVLAIACSIKASGIRRLKNILLSTDYVPRAIVQRLNSVWGCRVFNHYGMTESGLGGGVDCEAVCGYHLREADLYYEIIDPQTGISCPDGVTGEVVFTTLTRQGMPLIRYRTGDIARIIPEPCPCGSSLRRMDWVLGRRGDAVSLISDCFLFLSDLDEALFSLPGLLDYRVTDSLRENSAHALHIDIHSTQGHEPTGGQVIQCLKDVPAIRKGLDTKIIGELTVAFSPEGRCVTTGTSKRRIVSHRL